MDNLNTPVVGKPNNPQHVNNAEQIHPQSTLWIIVLVVLIGTIGRVLVSGEKFDAKKLVGELMLATIGGVALWSYGILQHFDPAEQVLYGCLAGLGGVRLLEWVIKALRAMKPGQQ